MKPIRLVIGLDLVAGELTKGTVFTTLNSPTELYFELEELQVSLDTKAT